MCGHADETHTLARRFRRTDSALPVVAFPVVLDRLILRSLEEHFEDSLRGLSSRKSETLSHDKERNPANADLTGCGLVFSDRLGIVIRSEDGSDFTRIEADILSTPNERVRVAHELPFAKVRREKTLFQSVLEATFMRKMEKSVSIERVACANRFEVKNQPFLLGCFVHGIDHLLSRRFAAAVLARESLRVTKVAGVLRGCTRIEFEGAPTKADLFVCLLCVRLESALQTSLSDVAPGACNIRPNIKRQCHGMNVERNDGGASSARATTGTKNYV